MNISIASDHAGFEQKQALVDYLAAQGHDVIDRGPDTDDRVDYPDYAELVARDVAGGAAERGVLVCGTGIGMAVAANKVRRHPRRERGHPAVRRRCRREHNDANVVTLSGRFVDEETNRAILDAFLATRLRRRAATPAAWRRSWPSKPSEAEPTARACSTGAGRCASISCIISDAAFRATRARIPKGTAMPLTYLPEQDPAVADALRQELARERDSVELIASENFTSPAVLEAVGSVLTNKYAEGYPGKRYYGGCEYVDIVEDLARERAKRALRRRTSPTCSPTPARNANLAAYFALHRAGRHRAGHEPGPRRPPHARLAR